MLLEGQQRQIIDICNQMNPGTVHEFSMDGTGGLHGPQFAEFVTKLNQTLGTEKRGFKVISGPDKITVTCTRSRSN
jgi:hypothetical protein